MSNRTKWLGGVCAAACLAAGGVVAGAGAESSNDNQGSEPEYTAASATPVAAVEPEQSREIGELRRGRSSDDALPAQWKDELSDPSNRNEHWGANPALARRTAPGVWIVPGDGYVCVANATPGEGALGFGCATPRDVDRGLLAPSDVDANGNGVLTGVVPDGVGHVTVLDRNGSTRQVQVDNNTYRVAIDADLKEVRFTGSDGAERVLPMAWDR